MTASRMPFPESVEQLTSRRLRFNLEPTFRCNLSCSMCPRFSSTDPQLDMPMETFSRIAANFAFAHTVDFTGWGEPLLNTHLFRMMATASSAACTVTCTSNGTALTEENSHRLIDAGVNVLTISIDGITATVYEQIRAGADFQRVTANLRTLTRLLRSQANAGTRRSMIVCVAFTIQESNWEQLSDLVDWVDSVGAQLIHLKHLNVVSTAADLQNSLLKYRLPEPGCESYRSRPQRLERAEGLIGLLQEKAAQRGIAVFVHSEYPLTDELRPRHCLAAPLDAVYFSYDGMVSPCCHFGHTVSRFFQGRYEPPRALFYGDIKCQDFLEIWNSPQFQAFRRGFVTEDYSQACRSCYLLYGK